MLARIKVVCVMESVAFSLSPYMVSPSQAITLSTITMRLIMVGYLSITVYEVTLSSSVSFSAALKADLKFCMRRFIRNFDGFFLSCLVSMSMTSSMSYA